MEMYGPTGQQIKDETLGDEISDILNKKQE